MDQGSLYPSFDQVSVATMTLVTFFTGFEVRVEAAYQLLPITRIEGIIPKKRKKDSRPLGPSGAITSLRFKDQFRGIYRPTKERKYFKNCATVDISTPIKDLSIKISREKLHMCGAKSEAIARQGFDSILEHLKDLDGDLRYIQQNIHEAEMVRKWLLDSVKGEPTFRKQRLLLGPTRANVPKTFAVFSIPDHKILSEKELVVPENRDQRIAKVLCRLIRDFAYHSDLVHVTSWVLTLESIFEQKDQGASSANGYKPLPVIAEIGYSPIYRAMTNYNYHLGGTVNRWALCQKISHPFSPSYDNAVHKVVTIRLPYSLEEAARHIPQEWLNKRRKSKGENHTFVVCRSGSIMQSSPNEEIAEKAYHEFMREVLGLGVVSREGKGDS